MGLLCSKISTKPDYSNYNCDNVYDEFSTNKLILNVVKFDSIEQFMDYEKKIIANFHNTYSIENKTVLLLNVINIFVNNMHFFKGKKIVCTVLDCCYQNKRFLIEKYRGNKKEYLKLFNNYIKFLESHV